MGLRVLCTLLLAVAGILSSTEGASTRPTPSVSRGSTPVPGRTTAPDPCDGFCKTFATCSTTNGRPTCSCPPQMKYTNAGGCVKLRCSELGCDYQCTSKSSSKYGSLNYCECPYGKKLAADASTCIADPDATPTCTYPTTFNCQHGSCTMRYRLNSLSQYALMPTCSCREGYSLRPDGRSCRVVDGCKADGSNGGCDSYCTPLSGGQVKCSCPSSHVLDVDQKTCVIKSCNNGNTGCEQECHQGGPNFWFCTCRTGYELNADQLTCTDVDECQQMHGCEHRCVPDKHFYKCACYDGYKLNSDGFTCSKLSACAVNNNGCAEYCNEPDGSCSCRPGYELQADQKSCRNINECAKNKGGCSYACKDTIGSYECTCPANQVLSNDRLTCVRHVCRYMNKPVNGKQPVCTGRDLGDTCTFECDDAYTVVGGATSTCGLNGVWSHQEPVCEDTNECLVGSHKCQHGCYNIRGGYICSCYSNSTLANDGFSCIPKVDTPLVTNCPKDQESTTLLGKPYAEFSWVPPQATSSLTGQPATCQGECPSGLQGVSCQGASCPAQFTGRFPVGAKQIQYSYGKGVTCSFKIRVTDDEPPKVTGCPASTQVVLTTTNVYKATWAEPVFTDNSGKPLQLSYSFNVTTREFLPGNHTVTYSAADESGNFVMCQFELSVSVPLCPPLRVPAHGKTNCDSGSLTVNCHPSCDPGYAFYELPAERYHCDAGAAWIPSGSPPDCFKSAQPLSGKIGFEAQYKFTCPIQESEKFSVGRLLASQFNSNRKLFCVDQKSCILLDDVPTFTCTNNILTAMMYTNDPIFTIRNLTAMHIEFKTRIHIEQVAQPALFSIAVFTRVPPIVAPNASPEDVIVQPRFDLICPAGYTQVQYGCVQCPPGVTC